MNPICRKCKGATIAAVGGALILHCPIDQEKQKCPYLPPEQHTHNEIFVPPPYQNMTVVIATTAGSISHDLLIDVFDDPERPGFKKHVIKLKN